MPEEVVIRNTYRTMVFITLQNTYGLLKKKKKNNNNNNKGVPHAYTTLGCNWLQKQIGVHGKFQVEKRHNCVKNMCLVNCPC